MENQSSRNQFRNTTITHFRYEWPKNDDGEIIELFSTMTYKQKKQYIQKLKNLAHDLPDDAYLAEMIHLAQIILISTKEQLLALLWNNTIKTNLLTTVLTLWITVVYSRRPISPYVPSMRKEDSAFVV